MKSVLNLRISFIKFDFVFSQGSRCFQCVSDISQRELVYKLLLNHVFVRRRRAENFHHHFSLLPVTIILKEKKQIRGPFFKA